MSHDATNWAIKQRGIKPALKVVLWNLCDRYHPDNGCFPSQETLAEDCEVPRSTLNVYLESLEKAGLIAREQRRKKGSQTQERTRYRFAFEPGFAPVSAENPSPETGLGEADEAESRNAVEPSPENGESRVQNLDSNLVREPVREPVNEREGASEDLQGKEGKEAIERAFKRWYPTWPTYLSDSEDAARKAWFGLSASERAECIDRTSDFVAAVKAQKNPKFTFSSVYLNGKAWRKLPEKAAEAARSEPVAPFGKAWMATRLAEFIKPLRVMPKAPPIVQMKIDAGGEGAEDAIITRNAIYGWPKIHEMNEAFRSRQALRAAPDMLVAGSDFISTEIAGDVGQAWKRLHRRMRFPWLPIEPKYAYFPPIEVGADDLDAAVAAAFWNFRERIEGHVHAAAE